MTLSIPILYGSVRTDRVGMRAAQFLQAELQRRGHTAPIVDPAVDRLPLLDRMYKEFKGDAPPMMEKLASLYRGADAFIIVSGEYNHGIPPALKNLLDHFLEEYFWRPSAIACYSAGQFGGVRAAMQLRMVLGELGMPSIPTVLPFPRLASLVAEDGTVADARFKATTARFLDELEWYARALKAERANGVPY